MIWTSPSKPEQKRKSTQAVPIEGTPLRTLKSFLSAASRSDSPALLDLGPALSSNIEFFGRQGFKIYVEDFLRNYLDSEKDLASDSHFLSYPDGAFDGILCWDIFDFMESKETAVVLQRLFPLLKERGLAIALFDAKINRQARILMRHKIAKGDHVLHEPICDIRARTHHHPNREIMKLFHAFDIVKSYFHKSNFREYLFQKKRDTAL
jgi:hypothetical protein